MAAGMGNHEVMMRGTFGNIRIVNKILQGEVGPKTIHIPTGEKLYVYDAAMVSMVIFTKSLVWLILVMHDTILFITRTQQRALSCNFYCCRSNDTFYNKLTTEIWLVKIVLDFASCFLELALLELKPF